MVYNQGFFNHPRSFFKIYVFPHSQPLKNTVMMTFQSRHIFCNEVPWGTQLTDVVAECVPHARNSPQHFPPSTAYRPWELDIICILFHVESKLLKAGWRGQVHWEECAEITTQVCVSPPRSCCHQSSFPCIKIHIKYCRKACGHGVSSVRWCRGSQAAWVWIPVLPRLSCGKLLHLSVLICQMGTPRPPTSWGSSKDYAS